jgi:pyruvate/2-oxoglutarate dehydrogenase complex dihydrolipoamide acyltransferase (E2) component
MMRSQELTATCHTVVECDFSAVERRRRELRLTALPLVAGAVVNTLREYPELNATLDGETVTRYGERVHLGIAVSLGAEGLIVPVVRDAQEFSLRAPPRGSRIWRTRPEPNSCSPTMSAARASRSPAEAPSAQSSRRP